MWDVREHSTAAALHWALHPVHPADRRTASRKPCSEPARGAARLSAGVLALGWILHAASAQAVEFSYGNLQGNLDTTISHGQAFRVGRRDDRLTSDINGNDGNLNYDYGLISFTNKFTSDLELNYDSFGIFVRATGFVDSENESGSRQRTQLSAAAKDLVAKDFEVLDAYVTGGLELGGVTTDLRFGKHVLNWGESTFIQNGINALNPFDVSKLRLPGSELREALEPVAMVSLSVVPTDAVSVEGFYQIDWEETEIDPVGSYFSVTDYVGAGARKAILVLPGSPGFEFGIPPGPEPEDEGDPDFLSVLRGPDREPSNAGQWGLALRYLAEELNETEFGFYFVNYHSRLPVVGARTGTEEGINDGRTAFSEAVAEIPGVVGSALIAAGCAVPPQTAMCGQIATQTGAQAGALAGAAGINIYGKTGNYFISYPEDIQLFGFSFNSQLGASGWALQGEYSFRRDAPQQVAEAVVLGAGLAPIAEALATVGGPPAPPNYLGLTEDSTETDVPGYIPLNVTQIQATATKVFGPILRADSFAFVVEAALQHVHGMSDTLPLESAAGISAANATAYGYRVAGRLDYNNAIGAVNLFPYAQFQHDVNGSSPSPGGSFVDRRLALTLGVRASYLNNWGADLGYTRYSGKENELNDRDFITATVNYSF